jgi:hypothetical protein
MPRPARWIHLSFEVIGVTTVIVGVGWLLFWGLFIWPMSHFGGGHCTDTDQRVLASPDGKRTIKTFHRTCGTNDNHPWDFVYLSTGNPNAGYEYTPIVTIESVASGQTSVVWDSPEQISVSYLIRQFSEMSMRKF